MIDPYSDESINIPSGKIIHEIDIFYNVIHDIISIEGKHEKSNLI